MVRVGFDIDGVLADFTHGFTRKAQLLGLMKEPHSNGAQQTWEFPMSKRDVNKVWRSIDANSFDFWNGLETLVTPGELRSLAFFPHEIVHVSNRKDRAHVRAASELWLARKLIPGFLHLTDDKARTVDDLGIDYMIEDNPDNIRAMFAAGINVYVRDWPYNRDLDPAIPRVGSVAEYLEIIRRETA